jgi:hypothetical protein
MQVLASPLHSKKTFANSTKVASKSTKVPHWFSSYKSFVDSDASFAKSTNSKLVAREWRCHRKKIPTKKTQFFPIIWQLINTKNNYFIMHEYMPSIVPWLFFIGTHFKTHGPSGKWILKIFYYYILSKNRCLDFYFCTSKPDVRVLKCCR